MRRSKTGDSGERFTLIEPPVVPDKPVEPNRPAIMLMGLLLSFAGGFGNLTIWEVMDKGVRGARAVQMITHTPPLAVIPFIPTRAERRRRVRKRAIIVAAAVVFMVMGVVAVHFFVRPLDLLWFTLLRKLDA